MQKWQLWTANKLWREITDIEPVLDCWDKKTSKAQIKLQGYLNKLKSDLGPLPSTNENLFLHMDIVVSPEHYLHDHDLDNYLKPVVYALGASHFVFVSATKHTKGKSQLFVGVAQPQDKLGLPLSSVIDAGKQSVEKKPGKGEYGQRFKINSSDKRQRGQLK